MSVKFVFWDKAVTLVENVTADFFEVFSVADLSDLVMPIFARNDDDFVNRNGALERMERMRNHRYFSKQGTLLEQAAALVLTMIQNMRKGISLPQIQSYNEQLQGIEGEADKVLVELLRAVYSGRYDGVQALFLKDVYELLERVVDRCRDAGNVITHIVLKNS